MIIKMAKEEIITVVENFVRESIRGYDASHDWWHIDRVRRMSLYIARSERRGDLLLTEAAALLHETGDSKFCQGEISNPAVEIPDLLIRLGFTVKEAKEVLFINRNISFSSGFRGDDVSAEFMAVQDADRLDAIGAIGIARAFCYGGFRGSPLYDPDEVKDSVIGHFYDKLLKLKEMMNTETGRRLAIGRHRFMEVFLERFFRELKK